MVAQRKNTKGRLMSAAVRVVAAHGLGGATTKAIAREVGVTEGAIYRHYLSKEELLWAAYKQVIDEMAEEKEHIASGTGTLLEKLRQWVRVTYVHFDESPDAFSYVLLTPHRWQTPEQEQTASRQGNTFMRVYREGCDKGEAREMDPALALSHFTGVMLNVPRLINEGRLKGPAVGYTDEVVGAVWRLLNAEEGTCEDTKRSGF